MGRLLTLLMMIAFVASQGSAFAAAVCHHQDAQAHATALRSHDSKIAGQALTEDEAGSIASKKGSQSDAGSSSPAMLAPAPFSVPFRIADSVRRLLANTPDRVGISVRPLLQPPLG